MDFAATDVRDEVRGTLARRGGRYEVRGTRYEVRRTRYEVRGTRYEVRGTRYEGRGTRVCQPTRIMLPALRVDARRTCATGG